MSEHGKSSAYVPIDTVIAAIDSEICEFCSGGPLNKCGEACQVRCVVSIIQDAAKTDAQTREGDKV